MSIRLLAPLLVGSLAALGCGSSEGDPANGGPGDAAPDVAAPDVAEEVASEASTDAVVDGGATDAPAACPRTPSPEGAARKVVVSHPFDASAKKTGAMEVLDLAPDGTLTRGSKTFALGAAAFEPMAFTPDGKIGLVPEDDGTLGVFRFDDAGEVTVVHAAFKGSFYASRVVMHPDGQRAIVVDSNTVENGGGLYVVDIGCDGALTDRGKLVTAKSWQVFAWLTSGARAIATGGPGLGSPDTVDTHLLDWKAPPSLVASTAAFPDREAIPSSIAIMPDDKLALVADNGILVGNRVAVVSIEGDKLVPRQVFTLDNPATVVASPYGNAALVLNSDGKDGYTLFKTQASPTAPFVNAGKLAYVHGKPQLPYVAALIARGPLKGRVLIGENLAVRQLQFRTDATVADVSKLAYPDGYVNIVGTVGVQP
ncbi:MAG: hypothetical protein HYV09_38535 [Deltaproteobacteria bacterium]|nr:hypothetical protein [Deltaproteobacteria bacterium]